MTTIDHKLKNLYQSNPSRYRYLESILISREIHEGGSSEYTVSIVLADALSSHAGRASYVFEGAQQVRIGHLEGLISLILDVRSIRDRAMEDLNYHVVESEENAWNFFCRDFSFNIK